MKPLLFIISLLLLSAASAAGPPVGSAATRMDGCLAVEQNTVPKTPSEGIKVGICLGQINTALYYLSREPCFHAKGFSVSHFTAMVNKFLRDNPALRDMDFNDVMYLAAGQTYNCAKPQS